MTVHDYFTATLKPSLPVSKDLATMPLDSNCGRDCRKAIDAARAFQLASDPIIHGRIAAAAHETCLVFING